MSFNVPGAGGSNTPNSSGQSSGSLFGTTGGQQNKPLFGGSATPASSGSMFGGDNTATSGGSSMFGGNQSATSEPSLFGNTSSTPASGGLFGGGNTGGGGSGGGFSFGQQTQSNTPASSAPEAAKPSTPSLFGNTPGQQGSGTPAFGGGSSGGSSIFGNLNKDKDSTPKTSAPLFGSAAPAPSSGGLFGNMGQQALSTPSGGNVFGAASGTSTPKPPESGQQSQGTSNLFGGGAKPTAPSSGGLFSNLGAGNTASQSGTSTPQGNKTTSAFPSTTPAGNPPANSIFGAPKQNDNQQPATTASSKPAFSFPPSGGQSGGSGPSLFGEVKKDQSSSTPFAPGGAGSQSSAGQSSAIPATTASSMNNLFGNLGGSQSPAPQPTSTSQAGASAPSGGLGGFTLGGQAAASSSSQPASTAATAGPSLFGGAASAATPAASGPSLFGGNTATSQPAKTTSTSGPSLFGGNAASSQPATGASTSTPAPAAAATSTAAAGVAGAGASTTGPTPAPQSRLAQKSMDEILTTWSTSLASHQKTFASLASTVSKWDRMLVENSTAISSLYGRCFQAERDCTEVERQVSVVERGQNELEALLDKYEGEVDKMMESADLGVDGLSGVDAEREKTYKAAESCSARLTDMSHSLTSMIDEINAASAKLNSNSQQQAKQDDPLAQIVRVLNGHLAQLQQIDSGAAALQKRVETAQKEARVLEGNRGIGGGAWVEDFGRSYGRRN